VHSWIKTKITFKSYKKPDIFQVVLEAREEALEVGAEVSEVKEEVPEVKPAPGIPLKNSKVYYITKQSGT
jgi:hypothetical protein